MFEQFSQLSKEEYLKLFSNKNGKEARIKQANV
jgi:hypothetical protein